MIVKILNISWGRYYRRVALPAGVDEEKVKANFNNGVLEVEIPKVGGGETKKLEIK